MDTTIISWTPTNWATVFLMALGGFMLLKGGFILADKLRNAKGNA